MKFLNCLFIFIFGCLRIQSQSTPTPPTCTESVSCSAPYDYTITDGQSVNDISTYSFTNKKIYLEGEFIISSSSNFNCCTFITNSSSKITINNSKNINMTDCSFQCNEWDGIYGLGNNRVVIKNSYFSYFNTAISLINPSTINLQGNTFINGGGGIGMDLQEVNATQAGLWTIASNYFEDCEIGIKASDCYSVEIGYYSFPNNIFEGCTYGISSYKSDLYIYKTLFNNCEYGITSSLDPDEYGLVRCVGIVDDPDQYTFNHCLYGIRGNRITVSSEKCHYYETQLGVDASNNCLVTLTDNKYEYNDEIDVPSLSFYLGTDLSNSKIKNNHIIRGLGGFGVFASTLTNLTIYNECNFEGAGSNQNYMTNTNNYFISNTFDNFQNYFQGVNRTDLYDNHFNGGYRAVQIESSPNNNLCTNTFYGYDRNSNQGNYGLKFNKSCPTTQMGANSFSHWYQTAFEVRNADISLQDQKANIWEDNSNPEAYCVGNPLNSRFNINEGINANYLPATRNPSTGWFFNNYGASNSPCYRRAFPSGLLDNNDYSMIADTFSSTDYGDWYQKLSTFGILLDSSSFLSVTANNDFYENQLTTDVEYVYKTWRYIVESKNNLELDTTLEQKYDQLIKVMDTIADINTTLLDGPDSELMAHKSTLASTYSDLKDDIESIQDDINTYRTSKLEDAAYYNDLISGSSDLTLHEKFINSLIIEKIGDAEFELSESDYDSVLTIASLCPEIYGNSVFHAMNLLNRDDIIAITSGDDPCAESIILSNKEKYTKQEQIAIQPNPLRNKLILHGKIDDTTLMSILNLNGIQLYSGKFKQGMDVDYLESGIYILHLQTKDGGIYNLRLCKTN